MKKKFITLILAMKKAKIIINYHKTAPNNLIVFKELIYQSIEQNIMLLYRLPTISLEKRFSATIKNFYPLN